MIRSLARIDARDEEIRAWKTVAPHAQLRRDARAQASRGPLAGLPIGVKDIIDTAGLPTGYGCDALADYRPAADADIVTALRYAGAVIVGKTATAAFAYRELPDTRNPAAYGCSPGGSSSGSAAAVADFMVPLAIGTQTGGSVVRPAAYCGVVGFKPTYARYSMDGIQPLSPSCDTLGFFARRVDDVRFLDECLGAAPDAVRPRTAPRVLVPTPFYEPHVGDVMAASFERFVGRLVRAGWRVERSGALPALEAAARNDDLFALEAHLYLRPWLRARNASAGRRIGALLARGRAVTSARMQRALRAIGEASARCAGLFARYDLILLPASHGAAPMLSAGEDSNLLNRLWTHLHMPVISVPFDRTADGAPLGLQAVGRWNCDRALLDRAEALEQIAAEQCTR